MLRLLFEQSGDLQHFWSERNRARAVRNTFDGLSIGRPSICTAEKQSVRKVEPQSLNPVGVPDEVVLLTKSSQPIEHRLDRREKVPEGDNHVRLCVEALCEPTRILATSQNSSVLPIHEVDGIFRVNVEAGQERWITGNHLKPFLRRNRNHVASS